MTKCILCLRAAAIERYWIIHEDPDGVRLSKISTALGDVLLSN